MDGVRLGYWTGVIGNILEVPVLVMIMKMTIVSVSHNHIHFKNVARQDFCNMFMFLNIVTQCEDLRGTLEALYLMSFTTWQMWGKTGCCCVQGTVLRSWPFLRPQPD